MGQLKAIITELQEMTNELAAFNDKPMALDSFELSNMAQQWIDEGVADEWIDYPSDIQPKPKYQWKFGENKTCGYCGSIKPNPWECNSCRNMD